MDDSLRPLPLLLIAALFLALYVAPIGVRAPSAPDEFRYAEIPREMIESGDWVVPRLVGLDYFEKPVLGYWLTAATMVVTGPSIVAARLPSALCTGITAMLLFFLLVRAGAGRYAAGFVAVAGLTALMPFVVGMTGVLDAQFNCFVTAAMVLTFLALEASEGRTWRRYFAGAGVAVGLAFLTKGFLAFAVPGVALLPYLLLTRSLGRFLARAWLPALTAAVVILPWSIAVGLETDFWHRFFWVEHVQRFVSAGDNQHARPVWWFLPRLVAGALPWSLLLPAAMVGLKVSRGERDVRWRLRLFAAFWLLMPLLLFSASSGKLAAYILPCIPPALVLLVEPSVAAADKRGSRVLGFSALLDALLGGLLVVGLVVAVLRDDRISAAFNHNQFGWWLLGLGAAAWAGCGVFALITRSAHRRLLLIAASPVLFLMASGFAADEWVLRTPGGEITARLESLPPDTVLASDRDGAQAVAWMTRRTDVEIFRDAGEFAHGLTRDSDRELLLSEDLSAIITEGGKVAVLLSDREWGRTAETLPEPLELVTSPRFVLALYGLP